MGRLLDASDLVNHRIPGVVEGSFYGRLYKPGVCSRNVVQLFDPNPLRHYVPSLLYMQAFNAQRQLLPIFDVRDLEAESVVEVFTRTVEMFTS